MNGESSESIRTESDRKPSPVAESAGVGRGLAPRGRGARGRGATGQRGGGPGRHDHVAGGLGQLGRAQLGHHALSAGLAASAAAPQLQPPRPLRQALLPMHI